MIRKPSGMKPQDVLVLLKLLQKNLSQKNVAYAVGISQAEVSHAMRRLSLSRLIDSESQVNRTAALEFLVHGLKYVFPAIIGPVARGVPTAYSHPNIKIVEYDSADSIVWPSPDGEIKGHSISPIYSSAVQIAKKDPQLYEYLSLLDMIRIGRAREVKFAADRLKKKFEEPCSSSM